MRSSPRPACLIIADISGYTSYLAGVELDHAQDILADLMDTVVGALRPAFRLAKLEGDAAFVYAVIDRVDSSVLQDTVEGCYFAFQRRLRDIRQATSCPCDACTLIPTLGLKLIAHHGVVAEQRMAGRAELMGRDVIVVHRLLKNTVEADLGIGAYAAYTEACVGAMGLDDPAEADLRPHRETYDTIGEVAVWVRDLAAAWQAEQQRATVVVKPDQTGWSVEADLPGSPALVWTILTAPEHRLRWQAGITGFAEETRQGRRGVGTVNHCRHGKDTILEEILDWQPPHHQTVRVQMPIAGVPRLVFTDVLESGAMDGTTRFTMRVQRPRSRKDREVLGEIWPHVEQDIRAGLAAADALLQAEVDRRAEAEPDAVDSVMVRSS